MSPPMNTIFDLFCGTGGFSYGIEQAIPGRFETRLGVDILSDALKTFSANHKNATTVKADIRKLSCQKIREVTGIGPGDVSVIAGGPPCQGFSSIRPFRSSQKDDPRNSLFEQFANFVNYFQPPVIVMENVVGLATHDSGKTIDEIIKCFSNIGYECDWKILNAAHFGVPQKRERLILMGVLKGLPLVFPTPSHKYIGSTVGYKDKRKMLVPVDLPLFQKQPILENAISVMDAIGDLPEIESGQSSCIYTNLPFNKYQRDRRNGAKTLELHSSTKHSEKMLEIIKHSGPNITCIPKHLISSGFSTCYSRLAADEPSVTITVNFVHPASNRCIHPIQNRALTPREGARIQSFDDTYQFVGTRTQIVKQIGNAVPPLLGKAVGLAISKILSANNASKSDAFQRAV